MNTPRLSMSIAMFVGLLAATVGAEAFIETVPVGNPGNAPDTRYETPGYGRVDYVYNIGRYEVTAGQYTEFLNAVAATDTYGLYNPGMWLSSYGCKIERSGTPGSYAYSVANEWVNRSVNFVSWGDAARFANWLHNGQPTGPQDMTTTEDGSYFVNGATDNPGLMAIAREPDATWVIPSENEWYKAAYHKDDPGEPGGDYWDYPTSSNSPPGYVNNNGNLSGTGAPFTEGGADPGNYATYDGDEGTDGIGSPYYRTVVGEWEDSASPYGTFDQGGNVWEWNEVVPFQSGRGLRGGSYVSNDVWLHASYREGNGPQMEDDVFGFRVAQVPEPATIMIFAVASVAALGKRQHHGLPR